MKIKKKSVNLSLFLLSLMATGCNSYVTSTSNMKEKFSVHSLQEQVAIERQTLESKEAIHKLSDIKYSPIEGDGVFIQLNENSQVFSFDSGKSYVSAYSIDGKNIGKTVNISSPLDFSVFIPSVMILDESFNIINVIKSSNFPYSQGSFGANLYKGEISLPDGYSRLYLLIFTTRADASGSTAIDSELLQNSMRYDRVSDVGKFSRLAIPHSTTGRMKLDIIKSDNGNFTTNEAPVRVAFCQQDTSRPVAGINAQEYYKKIRKDLFIKDYEQAIMHVLQAECAGFKKARDVFFSVIEENEGKKL